MGSTVLPYRYRINGLIDTSRTAINNLELIGNSCATWITYDAMDGKWAVVINRAGNAVHAFDDNNIIGAIKLNGTGLIDQYNAVEVRFPHRDLNDQTDWVRIEIPAEDRLPGEPDNTLTIDLPLMNEPIQAQIVGLIELKQARLDKVITFQTDYSKINLEAGNIVTVTNSVYGWTNKLFRIIRIEETDVDGAIVIEITALEYDANVYDLSDLYRYPRSNQDGILTQGALGIPSQPTIVKYEADANPRVDISSLIPDNTDPLNQAGIIEAMEFWISTDGTNYTLLGTKRPASATTFAAATEVTFSYNNVNTDFYVKTRCSNSTTTSDFSSPTSVIFEPKQVTDAIGENTKALDAAGNNLPLLLLLPKLLGALDGFLGGNENAFNSVQKVTEVAATVPSATVLTKISAQLVGNAGPAGYGAASSNVSNSINVSYSINSGVKSMDIDIRTPTLGMNYQTLDQAGNVFSNSVLAQPAMALSLRYGANLSTATVVSASTIDWQSNYGKIIVANPPAGTYWLTALVLPTYDLSLNWTPRNGFAMAEPNTVWFYDHDVVTGYDGTMGFSIKVIE